MMFSIRTVTRKFSNAAVAGVVSAALFLFALPAGMMAQTSGTGSIEGTVADSTGAVVPNATVTAVNDETGVKTTAISTGAGRFVVSLLPPGTYDVSVEAAGFETLHQQHIVVVALSTFALNPKLSAGAATESIVVTDEPPTLQTEDQKLGSNISNETYDSLPLSQNQSARDPSSFIGLAVGVNSFSTQAAGPSTGSFNGGQTYQNETYIEGLALTSAGTESDTRNLAFGVSVEAVDQFQVAVTGADAVYEGQGVSNFIIKSGGNKFHGGIYEFFRNTIFDSKNFFSSAPSVERQNEFGGSLSGPILHNKLFFFANYDGYRFDSATPPTLQTIATLAERMGDFSAFASTVPIYDPTTCLATNAAGACISRQQFSCTTNGITTLNVICPGRLSTAAKSFQSYLPTTNYDGTPLGTGTTANYDASLPNLVDNDSGTAKVSYDISSRNRLTGIYTRGKYVTPVVGSLATPSLTANSALPVPYTDGRGVIEYATLAQAHDSYVFKPSLINDFGYGLSRLYIPLVSNTQSGNYPSKAGLTGLPPGVASTGFPDISFNGTGNQPVSWDGTNSHAFTEWQTTFTAQDNILWTHGKHQVTAGYQWQALQDNENTPLTGTQAGFTFSPNETSNYTSTGAVNTATGLAYASYLLGDVDSSSITQNAVAETGGRYKTNATYIQDNIQITPSLTINAGLRWDVWTPFHETINRMSFFNPNLANPVAGNLPGALEFAGNGPDSCGCGTPVLLHWHEFGPRLGFAYKATNTTVIRGAYDIFYAHAGGVGGRTDGRQGLSQIGFNGTAAQSSTVTGQPAYQWDNGIPSNPLPPPYFNPSYGIGFIVATAPGAASVGAGPGTAQTLVYGDPQKGAQAPQYQDFYLNVQHSFGQNTTLSVAYSGSVGRYLPGAAVAGPYTDQIPLKYLPLGSLLTTTLSTASIASAQALGFTVAAPFPGFTGTIGQALKPFPQYSSISDPWLDVGTSSYNSLQTTLNRRISNGLTFMVNYTFSKEEDNLAGVRVPGEDYLEYSVGGLDHKHVLQSTFVYKLPFGADRRFHLGNSVVDEVFGDWQLAGIVQVSTGAPISVGGTCTGGGIIDASCYPNVVPGVSAFTTGRPTTQAMAKVTQYINPAAFSLAPAYTYGNAARTAPDGLFAPTYSDLDFNVRKEFPLIESARLIVQADAFNALNEVVFSAPGSSFAGTSSVQTISNPTPPFGVYAAQANAPRKYQFSARITF